MTRKLLITWLLFLILHHGALAQVPVANFSANVTSGCSPLIVTFKDESSGNPTSWNWDFGTGNPSSLQNPTMSFATPGTYTVTLVVRNPDGTNGTTKTNYITVYPSPEVSFSASLTTGCIPTTIQFTDASKPGAGNLISWNWDFGDGETSTAQHPSHEYKAAGFYTVTLKIASSTGCQSTTAYVRYIRIVAGVIPDFKFDAPATCRPPFQVNFTNLTSGPGKMTYAWNLGNNTTSTDDNPTASYTGNGSYKVILNATSEFGCKGTVEKMVDLSGTATSFSGPDTVCINSTVTFTNGTSPAPLATAWNFGNGETANTTNGTSTYNTAGVFPVKMVNVYGSCKDSATQPLVVIDKPLVSFTAPVTTACKAPLTVNFQDGSAGATTWLWDFGDGTPTSTEKNPVHTYTTEGQFNVTLTITTRQGCTNSLTQPAFVKIVAPRVNFTNAPNGGCIPYPFSPGANATSLDAVTSYLWEYGEGAPATTTGPAGNTGPQHVYNTAGNYTIKVTITTAGGCTAFQELVNGIRTGTKPQADFSINATPSCASDPVQFTYVPTGTTPVDEYLWKFGDDSTSTEISPAHLYQEAGNFTVTMVSLNNKCKSVPVNKTVTIKPPISKFGYKVNCTNGRIVDFTNTSTVTGLTNLEYKWDFGDGTPPQTIGTNTPVSHTYAVMQPYNVTLTVTDLDAGGCSHQSTQKVELLSEAADFTVDKNPACKGELITITATPKDPSKITSYEWTVGTDAPTSGTKELFVRYDVAVNLPVKLAITDINGCTDEKTVNNAIVVGGPTAGFTAATPGGCVNNLVTFNSTSTSATPIQKYTFDFGDGTIKDFNTAPFTHAYADTNTYIVKLTVYDGKCENTYTSTDAIRITRPSAGFRGAFTTICPNTDLPFTDTASGKNLSWRWDFGDGQSSTEQSPIHRYTAVSGNFTVKQVITDENGCKDSVTRTDYITVKKPVAAFTAKDTASICPLLETKFTFAGADYESFFWDFGDGGISTLTNPNHFYNVSGTYEAKLYTVGYGGCLDSASTIIKIYDPYATSSVNYNPTTNCNNITVDFSLVTPPSTRFTFYFTDGATDESQTKTFQHFYKQPGEYAPYLILRDSIGCQSAPIGGPVTIKVLGVAPYFNPNKKTFCDAGTVTFTDFTFPASEPLASSMWDFGDGTTSTEKDPIHPYTQPGTYIVKHTATTVANNCTNTITDTIRVYATPDPRIAGDSIACINEALNLQATLAVPDTAITWKWDLGSNGQSAAEHVAVKYTQSGTYTVGLEASNKLGCKDNTTRTLFVPPTPTISVAGGNNVTLPVGIGVTLPVTYSDGIASYTWTPARDLTCTNCATPVANPRFTTTYTVRVEDTFGCTASAGVTVTVVCNKENYFVPNTFSPNNDGQNDVFMPRGRSIDRVNRMQVFNRWGELVFERRNFAVNDKSAGWDGTYKGKPAVADVYVYVIEFVCDNASVIPFRGNVTLLR